MSPSSTGKEGYSSNFFERNVDELHTVIPEAANWIESQQSSLQESNEVKAQANLKKRRRHEQAVITSGLRLGI